MYGNGHVFLKITLESLIDGKICTYCMISLDLIHLLCCHSQLCRHTTAWYECTGCY